jgi:ribosome-associated protein
MSIFITPTLCIEDREIELLPIRSQGAGGQNVNKVASAIHLRFDIRNSSLPAALQERLLAMHDRRISTSGEIIIKAQQFRTQDKNREDAIQRLVLLLRTATVKQKPRRPTRPSVIARKTRTDNKTLRGKVKAMRKKVDIPH